MDKIEEKEEKLTVGKKIFDSNDRITTETVTSIFGNKTEREEFVDDLIKYINDIKFHVTLGLKLYDRGVLEINNDEEASFILEEFRIASRQYIIAQKQKMIFLLRQEELLTIINKLQGRLEEYDKYASEHTKEEIMREYANEQLTEFATIRSQSIPMYMIELETIPPAIAANNSTCKDNLENAYDYAISLVEYIKTRNYQDAE